MAQEMVIRTSAFFKGVANPGTTPSKFAIFTGTDNLIGFRSSSELLTDLGFNEAVDDRVNSLLVAGSGISLVYDDPLNTLTIHATGGTGGSSINVTGIVVQTAPSTFVGRTITGTSNRISVTNGDGTANNPILDIAVTYTGQTSITTLGTISTGLWQGTKISEIYGGTNQNAYVLGDTIYASGTNTLARLSGNTSAVKQFLNQTGNGSISAAPIWSTLVSTDLSDFSEAVDDRVNSLLVAGSGISLVYDDPLNTLTIHATGNTGNILQNGNSFGTAVTIGSNDAFALNFETSGTTKGTIGTDGVFTLSNLVSNTSTIANRFVIQTNSDGIASNGFGGRILFQGESSTTINRDIAGISAYWSNATDSSRQSKIGFELVSNAGALTEFANIIMSGTNVTTFNVGASSTVSLSQSSLTTSTSFTVGNSSQTLTIGGNSGLIVLSTSHASGINLNATGNNASTFINSGFSSTIASGIKSGLNIALGFSPTSGNGECNSLIISGTIDQTGGASGTTRGILIEPVVTNIFNYRAIDISVNSANAYGIYQSGSSTKNYFNGNIGIKIDAPAQALDVNGIVRIRSVAGITPTTIIGRDANGDVGTVAIGSGLTFAGGTLTASGGSVGPYITVTEVYIEGQSGTTFDLDANIGEIKDVDGNNVAFTLPSNLNALEIYRNGQKIYKTGSLTTRDYNVNTSTNVITFVTSLTSDEIITIRKIV